MKDILVLTLAVVAADYQETKSCVTMTADVFPHLWKCQRHGVATVQGLGLSP